MMSGRSWSCGLKKNIRQRGGQELDRDNVIHVCTEYYTKECNFHRKKAIKGSYTNINRYMYVHVGKWNALLIESKLWKVHTARLTEMYGQ